MISKTSETYINGQKVYVRTFENFSQYRIGKDENTAPSVLHFNDGHFSGVVYGEEALAVTLKVFPALTAAPHNGAADDGGGLNEYQVLG